MVVVSCGLRTFPSRRNRVTSQLRTDQENEERMACGRSLALILHNGSSGNRCVVGWMEHEGDCGVGPAPCMTEPGPSAFLLLGYAYGSDGCTARAWRGRYCCGWLNLCWLCFCRLDVIHVPDAAWDAQVHHTAERSGKCAAGGRLGRFLCLSVSGTTHQTHGDHGD